MRKLNNSHDNHTLLMVISERVTNLQDDIRNLRKAYEEQSHDVVRIDDVDRRVANIEEWQRWVTRIVLGMIITAIVGMVIVGIDAANLAAPHLGR